MVNRLIDRLSFLLFPGCCLICQGDSDRSFDLCQPCQAELPWLIIACPRCAYPVEQAGQLCGQCLQKLPSFRHCVALCHYRAPIDSLIGQFKYQQRHSYGRVMAALLSERLLQVYQCRPAQDQLTDSHADQHHSSHSALSLWRLIQGLPFQCDPSCKGLAISPANKSYTDNNQPPSLPLWPSSTYPQQKLMLPDVIVPVPMHWRRKLSRGFNHCEQLAEQLGQSLQLPVFKGLRRIRNSPPQQGLSAAQRHRNLQGAFALQGKQSVEGLSIALLDDVITTGSTAEAISQLLLAAGARDVHIWSLARTPLHD